MRPALLVTCLIGLSLVAACEVTIAPLPSPHRLVSDSLAVDYSTTNNSLLFSTPASGAPVAILEGIRLVIGEQRQLHRLRFQHCRRIDDHLVLTCDRIPEHQVTLIVNLEPDGSIRVEARDEIALQSLVSELTLDYELLTNADPDEVWLPHGHATPDHVAGDGSFRTPLAYLRIADRAMTWLPDTELLAQERRIPQAFELDREPQLRLRHGLVCQTTTATGFQRQGAHPIAVQGETLRFAHRLRITEGATDARFGATLREMWTAAQPTDRPTTPSFQATATEFFPKVAAEQWIDLSSRKGAAGTIAAGRAATTDGVGGLDAWYEAEQSSVRTALGMLAFADRTRQPELRERAKRVLEHALSAPTRGGLSPALFLVDQSTRESRWVLDSRSSGDPEHYHAMDVATTCYWMLRMVPRCPRHAGRVLAVCKRAARFMRLNQQPSGAFPSYFEKEFLAPQKGTLHDQSAETGSVARFLIEYSAMSGDAESLASGRRAIRWIATQAQLGTWLDHESERVGNGARRDPRSGLPRQGTLGLLHCTLATLRLHQLHPEVETEHLAKRLLTTLAAHQQIFRPPWLTGTAFGGMGGGNFDHRWNDARQSIAALAFFHGYRILDDPHWLERGIAALRAGLTTGRQEYQPAADVAGPASTPHWGLGTACTVAELVRKRLGQGVVDIRRGRADGIDSIWFREINVDLVHGQVELLVFTHAPDLERARLTFRNLDEGRERLAIRVNDQLLGSFDRTQLKAGIEVRPIFVPHLDYHPPRIVHRRGSWSPNARSLDGRRPDRTELEFQIDSGTWQKVPMRFDAARRRLAVTEPLPALRDLTSGRVRSRVVYRVGRHVFRSPREGAAATVIGDFDRIDIGDRPDPEQLVAEKGTRIRRFTDGREFGRHLQRGSTVTYRLPIPPSATHCRFAIRADGALRVKAGELLLHEDSRPMPGIRDHEFELADHRLWTNGGIDLHLEAAPVGATPSADLAWIRYSSRGEVTSRIGLGETRLHRDADASLSILVQPVALLDRPLGAGRESLRQAFFGGTDYRVTPAPNSRKTTGSLAQYLETISGGVTAIDGKVLSEVRWSKLAKDLMAPEFRIDPETRYRWANAAAPDLVVVVLGPGPIPPGQMVRLGNRTVPLVFVPARSGDRGFLSCGAAATAVLGAMYGTQPLAAPEWGNFGALALSGTRVAHAPAAPASVNLVKTGWADHLALNPRALKRMVASRLLPGRVGYVLDCTDLPGRGRLFFEIRDGRGVEKGLGKNGALLYWQFAPHARPVLHDLGGRTCAPEILRLSPRLGRMETPHVPGRPSDLFDVPTESLPTATLHGERIWELRNFRPLADGRASVDVRYLATDLLRSAAARWVDAAGEVADLRPRVQRRDGRIVLNLAPGETIRLETPRPVVELGRALARIHSATGRVKVELGSATTRTEVTLAANTPGLWLQADLSANQPLAMSVTNLETHATRVELVKLWLVPRIPALHTIRPVQVDAVANPWLSDGVVYGRAFRLPASPNKQRVLSVPVVVPPGPAAIRVRCGLGRGVVGKTELDLQLRNGDGSRRRTLLPKRTIHSEGGQQELQLGVLEVQKSEASRVEFLEIRWRGDSDLYVVDLAVIRP